MLHAMSQFAMVTGAARRVGRATAIALAERGFNLALTRRESADDLNATAQDAVRAAKAVGHDIQVHQVHLDLADSMAVQQFAESWHHPVDVLVLNASRYQRSALGSIDSEALHLDYQVNAVAPLLLVQGLRVRLEKSSLGGGASVVAMGDLHAQGRPLAAYASYLMSKAALHQMVETLAVALAPGVRVNGILPGVVAWPVDADPELIRRYEMRIPLGRPGTPEDVARMVCAISLHMPYVTGQLIRLDGGRGLT
jgi:pteridine reductase